MEGKTIFRNQNLWAEKVRTGGHQLQNENKQNLNCELLRKVLQLHTYTCQKHSNTVPSLRRTGFPSQLPLLKINQCWTCQLAQQQTLQYFQKHKAQTTQDRTDRHVYTVLRNPAFRDQQGCLAVVCATGRESKRMWKTFQ